MTDSNSNIYWSYVDQNTLEVVVEQPSNKKTQEFPNPAEVCSTIREENRDIREAIERFAGVSLRYYRHDWWRRLGPDYSKCNYAT